MQFTQTDGRQDHISFYINCGNSCVNTSQATAALAWNGGFH